MGLLTQRVLFFGAPTREQPCDILRNKAVLCTAGVPRAASAVCDPHEIMLSCQVTPKPAKGQKSVRSIPDPFPRERVGSGAESILIRTSRIYKHMAV